MSACSRKFVAAPGSKGRRGILIARNRVNAERFLRQGKCGTHGELLCVSKDYANIIDDQPDRPPGSHPEILFGLSSVRRQGLASSRFRGRLPKPIGTSPGAWALPPLKI